MSDLIARSRDEIFGIAVGIDQEDDLLFHLSFFMGRYDQDRAFCVTDNLFHHTPDQGTRKAAMPMRGSDHEIDIRVFRLSADLLQW